MSMTTHGVRAAARRRGHPAVLLLAAVTGLSLLAAPQQASAQWQAAGTGPAGAKAAAVPLATNLVVAGSGGGLLSARTFTLTWPTTTVGVVPATGYVVRRTQNGAPSAMAADGTCPATATGGILVPATGGTQSCTDKLPYGQTGTYQWVVEPMFHQWRGPASAPTPPTS